MINKYNFNTKFLKIRARRKPAQVYEVGVAQMGMFFNQTLCDAIYQLYCTSSFLQTIHLSSNTIYKILTGLYLPWYIPWNCMSCKTYLTGQHARANWPSFAKNYQNNGHNTGGHNWLKLSGGGVQFTYEIYCHLRCLQVLCPKLNDIC